MPTESPVPSTSSSSLSNTETPPRVALRCSLPPLPARDSGSHRMPRESFEGPEVLPADWVRSGHQASPLISAWACSSQKRMSISRYIIVAVVRCSCVRGSDGSAPVAPRCFALGPAARPTRPCGDYQTGQAGALEVLFRHFRHFAPKSPLVMCASLLASRPGARLAPSLVCTAAQRTASITRWEDGSMNSRSSSRCKHHGVTRSRSIRSGGIGDGE